MERRQAPAGMSGHLEGVDEWVAGCSGPPCARGGRRHTPSTQAGQLRRVRTVPGPAVRLKSPKQIIAESGVLQDEQRRKIRLSKAHGVGVAGKGGQKQDYTQSSRPEWERMSMALLQLG